MAPSGNARLVWRFGTRGWSQETPSRLENLLFQEILARKVGFDWQSRADGLASDPIFIAYS